MSKGKETIDLFLSYIENNGGKTLRERTPVAAQEAQMKIYDIFSRAIACHCECLGMATEQYDEEEYIETMQKWGLIDKNDQPLI